MHTIRSVLVVIGMVLCLNGCVVLSFGPFYLEGSKMEMPPTLLGKWQPILLEGDDVASLGIHAWNFSKDEVTAYDRQNVRAEIEVTFFMLDGHLVCDSIAGTADEKETNAIWLYHLLPMHTISKVMHKGDTLTFVPLDYEWLEKALSEKKVELSSMLWEDMILFTATPEEWQPVLKACLANDSAFNEKNAFTFKRVSGEQPS